MLTVNKTKLTTKSYKYYNNQNHTSVNCCRVLLLELILFTGAKIDEPGYYMYIHMYKQTDFLFLLTGLLQQKVTYTKRHNGDVVCRYYKLEIYPE